MSDSRTFAVLFVQLFPQCLSPYRVSKAIFAAPRRCFNEIRNLSRRACSYIYVLAFTAHSLLVSCKNCFSSAYFNKSRSPFKTGKVSTRPIWEKSLALSLRSNVMIGSIFPSRPRKTNYLSRFLNVGIMTQSFGRGRRGRSQK